MVLEMKKISLGTQRNSLHVLRVRETINSNYYSFWTVAQFVHNEYF